MGAVKIFILILGVIWARLAVDEVTIVVKGPDESGFTINTIYSFGKSSKFIVITFI